jgi:hypothetical protein
MDILTIVTVGKIISGLGVVVSGVYIMLYYAKKILSGVKHG